MYNETFTTHKNITNIKIALLSDIHYFYPNFNKKTFTTIKKQIQDNKPDYICIVGDLIDEITITNIDELIIFLNDLSNISPIIYVMGNHELKYNKKHKWYKDDNPYFINEIKKVNNLYILEDSTYIDREKNIVFYGFNPSFEYYEKDKESYKSFTKEIAKLKTQLNDNHYNILLIHTPINIYRYIEENQNSELNKSDLILSGHMHNSCLPFFITHFFNSIFKITRGIISPKGDLFPKYSYGKITGIKNGYIHQGITKLGKSSGYNHFDKLYSKKVQFINIKKSS